MAKGLKENTYQRKHTGGTPPMGYDLDDEKKDIINAHEAEAVQLIFNMYVNECSYGEIIRELKNRNCASKRGLPISKVSLNDILNNEKYAGMLIFNRIPKRDKNGMGNRRLSRPEDEIIRIDGGMPVIIEKGVWEAAKARMKDIKVTGRNYSKTVYPLSGLVKCGYCGSNM